MHYADDTCRGGGGGCGENELIFLSEKLSHEIEDEMVDKK